MGRVIRRDLLLVGAAVFGLLLWLGSSWLPSALAEVELFHVQAVELEGARYLDREDAVAYAGLPVELSLWDDLAPVAARLRTHPLVLEARVRRRLPSTLVLEIRERSPVALLPTPVLRPVDEDGRLLPIDPSSHPMDLPLLQPSLSNGAPGGGARSAGVGGGVGGRAAGAPQGEGTLTPIQRRILAGEVARLEGLEPGMAAALSEVALDHWGNVVLRMGDPQVDIRYRPPLTPVRLREGLQVLQDALERNPDRSPLGVDLRFREQVVIRYAPSNPR